MVATLARQSPFCATKRAQNVTKTFTAQQGVKYLALGPGQDLQKNMESYN